CPGHFGSFTVATHIDACSLCRVPIAMRDSLPQPIHAGDPSNLHRLSPRAARALSLEPESTNEASLDRLCLPKISSRVTETGRGCTATPDGRVPDRASACPSLVDQITNEAQGRKSRFPPAAHRPDPQSAEASPCGLD